MTQRKDDLRAALAAMWTDIRLTTKEIGSRLGIGSPRVSQIAGQLGLPRRSPAGRRGRDASELADLEAEIRSRHAVLQPQRVVARTLHVSIKRVIAIERRLGLTRPRSGIRSRSRDTAP